MVHLYSTFAVRLFLILLCSRIIFPLAVKIICDLNVKFNVHVLRILPGSIVCGLHPSGLLVMSHGRVCDNFVGHLTGAVGKIW